MTIEQILRSNTSEIVKDKDYFYVRVKPSDDGEFDNTVWKVDKLNGKTTYMMYTDLFRIYSKTTPSSMNEFVRYFQNERFQKL